MSGGFKEEVGRLILMGAIGYCAMLTILLVVSMVVNIDIPQAVRDLLLIILTWFTTKAGTVVDHQFGSSAGEEKEKAMVQELQKKESGG